MTRSGQKKRLLGMDHRSASNTHRIARRLQRKAIAVVRGQTLEVRQAGLGDLPGSHHVQPPPADARRASDVGQRLPWLGETVSDELRDVTVWIGWCVHWIPGKVLRRLHAIHCPTQAVRFAR